MTCRRSKGQMGILELDLKTALTASRENILYRLLIFKSSSLAGYETWNKQLTEMMRCAIFYKLT